MASDTKRVLGPGAKGDLDEDKTSAAPAATPPAEKKPPRQEPPKEETK